MKKLITLLSIVLISKFSVAQDAALAPPSGSFTAPVSGCSLTSTENVTVRIFNYGPGSITTNFDVSYTINGGAPVVETVIAPNIAQNTSYTYTFTTQADLSVPGTYTFNATVSVPGDPTPGNNTYTGYVVNAISPSIGGTITAPSSVCVSGNSGTLTLTGHTGNVLGWQYSTDGGGTWINISNTSTTQSYNNLTVSTKYRTQVQNGACTPVYSAIATIGIDQVSVGGTISGGGSVCISGNSGVLTSGGGRVGSILKWQYSTNGGTTWVDTAVTSPTLNYLNLTASRIYRVEVANGACNSVFSSTASVNVNPQTVGGSITPVSTTICSGSNSGTLTLSGHTGSIVRWQYSYNNGSTWTNITNTTTSQVYSNLAADILYRVLIQSGNCAAVYSNTASLTVAAATVAGTVSSNASVCSGSNSGTLTLSGHSGSIQYWEYSTNGGSTYTSIPNTTTTQSYSNLTSTTIYRANVKNGSCTAANSGVATITVSPVSIGGTTSPNSIVCSGSNSGTITLSGHTGSVVNWASSTDGISWNNLANTTTTQAYSNLAATTYYQATVKSGVCSSVLSSIDTISVDAPSVGGVISASGTVCYGNNSGTLTLSGNTGNVVRWEYSVDNELTYTPIANTTSTYSYANITATTIYRAVVKNGNCSSATSATATLTVTPVSVGGTVSGNATVCSGSNSGMLTLSGRVGTVQGWESSTDGGTTWSPIINTSTSLSYSNILSTTFYRALVKSGACSNDTSSVGIITVDQVSAGGIISSSDTVCKNSNSGTLTLSGYTGQVQRWEFSSDGGITWLILGNSTTTQSYLNLSATTSYRAYVKNGSCNGTTSAVATIKVEDPIDAGVLSANASYCDTINSGSLTLTGTVGPVLFWQTSADGGLTWSNIANTGLSQSYTNIKVTTQYRAVVGNNGCGKDTSNVVTITISPISEAGTLSASDTVCYGMNAGTLHLSGYTGTITGWEQSTNGGTSWTPLAVPNMTDSLKYLNLTSTISYRVLVKSGICNADTSTVATLTVTPLANGGTIDSISVCDTINNGTLVLTGFVGNIEYWQSSVDGITWDSIANTSSSYTFTDLKDTTYFRAMVSTNLCGKDTSVIGIVYVNPKAVPGTLSSDTVVCAGNNSGTLYLTGYTGIVDSWEASTDGGVTWTPIVNTTDSLIFTNITVTTIYHAKVRSGNCNADTSTRVTVTVNPVAVGGTIPTSSVCDTINSGSITLVGSVGSVSNWEQSTDGGVSWISIPVTTTTLPYTNIKDTTLFRAIVKTLCSTDTSAVGLLYIVPTTIAGTLSKEDTVCSGSNQGTLHLNGYLGNIVGWEQSVDGGTTWTTITNTTDSLTYTNITTTTFYRVIVKNSICNADTSLNVKIFVNPVSVGGVISASSSGACAGSNSGTLTLTNYVGTIQNWESSLDGGANWIPIANATATLTYTNIMQTTVYRVIVQSGNCAPAMSNESVITLIPSPVAAFTADTVCLGSNTTFKNASSISSGVILYSVWKFGDGATSLSSNPVHTYTNPGTYDVTLELTSTLGCSDTAVVKVVVHSLPSSTIVSNTGKFGFCMNDSIKLMAASGTYNYLWNSTYNTKDLTIKTGGVYKLQVTDQVTGCMATDSVNVSVYNLPVLDAGADTTISLGNSVALNASSNTSITNWSWYPATGLDNASVSNPIATPLMTTTYNLLVVDVHGCVAIDSLMITVLNDYNVIISNLMTPNGDGYNDTWIIQNIENYPHTQVTVITRQGQEVFSSNSYDNKWDGTQDGKKLADGTYYYILKFEGDAKVLKGAITILGQDK